MTTSPFRIYAIAVASLVLVACSALSKITKPRSEGEQNSGFTYVPIDPFPVDSHRRCPPLPFDPNRCPLALHVRCRQ